MATHSAAVTYAGVIVFALCIGYFAGIASSLTFTRSSETDSIEDKEKNSPDNSEVEEDAETDNESEADEDLGSIQPKVQDDCTLLLVVRSDLGMSTGKIAAQ
ncbi:hypothetical protein M422DRAFT_46766 [Sphaerobolus stellatus SS14]|uniref:Uncharacterized protein n=1 Tax=Sphaerobolus stellatus (strain SS14) TaxID=990650 RepID=A0A0C9VFF3_SPHS4|nr:hypothetical protein M422DRAFT_46766 [Sphaerobolus stellatus SS14]